MEIFLKYLGPITYALLLATLVSGIRGKNIKYHKILAILTIIFATLHVVLRFIVD